MGISKQTPLFVCVFQLHACENLAMQKPSLKDFVK